MMARNKLIELVPSERNQSRTKSNEHKKGSVEIATKGYP